MTTLLAAAILLTQAADEWQAPTPEPVISGDASYYSAGLMDVVAHNRGLELQGYAGGVAMMRAGDIGRDVWLMVRGEWHGPYLVVDCAQRLHYDGLVDRGRVVELSRRDWLGLGLPEMPVPVLVSFDGPGMGGMVE